MSLEAPKSSFTVFSIIERFYSDATPGDALFPTKEAKVILPMSDAWYERSRVFGGGPAFTKIGSRVFYRKKDLLDFLNEHPALGSTSEHQAIRRRK
ncbi:MAG: hypothetical protein K0S08_769 [Gammaproteobacteria bacterium]|jgi:hypothetical protein|nr:hypothetical protein [Gammaproteobacteria bacterium]